MAVHAIGAGDKIASNYQARPYVLKSKSCSPSLPLALALTSKSLSPSLPFSLVLTTKSPCLYLSLARSLSRHRAPDSLPHSFILTSKSLSPSLPLILSFSRQRASHYPSLSLSFSRQRAPHHPSLSLSISRQNASYHPFPPSLSHVKEPLTIAPSFSRSHVNELLTIPSLPLSHTSKRLSPSLLHSPVLTLKSFSPSLLSLSRTS